MLEGPDRSPVRGSGRAHGGHANRSPQAPARPVGGSMQRNQFRVGRPSRKVIVGSVAALALLGGVTSAEAAIPGSGGVITACYSKADGSVRIIDAAKIKCKTGEIKLTWEQAGPMGPMGPEGPQG